MKSRKINNLLNIKSRKNKIKNNSTRRENFSNNSNKTLKNTQEKSEEENKPILKHFLKTQSGLGDKLMDLWASATISTLIKHKLYVKIKHLNRLQTTEKISKDMQHNYNFNNIKIPNTKFILDDYDKSYELFSKNETLIDDNLHLSVMEFIRSYSNNTPYFIYQDRDKYYNSKLKYNVNNYSYNEIIDTFKYVAYNTKLLLKNDDIKLNIYKDYIGIHIRATDKIVKNPPPWEMTIEYFNQLIILSTNYCKTLINHKNYNYVICSDDKNVASNFKNNLLEFNNNTNVIISDNTPEIDMTILSKTKEIIQVSRFTNFTLCASLLGNNKVKLFYDEMNDYDNSFYHRKHNLHFELIPRNVKNTMNIYFKNLFSNIQKKDDNISSFNNILTYPSNIKTDHYKFEIGCDKHIEIMIELFFLLDIFHNFSIKNNILYSVSCGNMLGYYSGCVILPWDDDIDLMVKDSDFDKIINLWNNNGPEYKIWDNNWTYKKIKLNSHNIILLKLKNKKFFKIKLSVDTIQRCGEFQKDIGGIDIEWVTGVANGDTAQSKPFDNNTVNLINNTTEKDYESIQYGPIQAKIFCKDLALLLLNKMYPRWKEKKHPKLF